MNIKRAFLTAVAVLMVPGFAMAQSTVTFSTTVMPAMDPAPDLTLTCNNGIPLSQTAPAGTTFVVQDIMVGALCSIVLAGDLDAGYETDTVCEFVMADADNYVCDIVATPIPYDFSVTVDWIISDDADEGVGDTAMVDLWCEDGMTTVSTSGAAGPNATMPVVLASVVPDATCYAELSGFGSAVDVDDSACDGVEMEIGEGDVACTITATAFYEGIPTLSQYGMAIMALLMLGVGFVGFRRFV